MQLTNVQKAEDPSFTNVELITSGDPDDEWILANGIWNDAGKWIDSESWLDN
jgi:hypothetical protein